MAGDEFFVGLHGVEFEQRLHAHAVFLRDAVERFAFFRHIEFHGRVAVELLLHPDALALAWTRVAVGDIVVVENVFQFFGVYESMGQRVNDWSGGFWIFRIFRGLEDSVIRDLEKSIYWLQKIGVNRIKMD